MGQKLKQSAPAVSYHATRRGILGILGIGIALPVITACGSSPAEARNFPVQLSDAEWRRKLTKGQYHILREAGTERSYTSPLNKEKRRGTYACAGCDTPLYSSRTKYDSRTGWPSFWAPISSKAIGTSTDYKIGYPRTEVHCATCGGHLGHIFSDGPKPTGKRHCINGLALNFHPE